MVNQFFLELLYFAAFGRESRKGTGGVKKYAKFEQKRYGWGQKICKISTFFGPPCSL